MLEILAWTFIRHQLLWLIKELTVVRLACKAVTKDKHPLIYFSCDPCFPWRRCLLETLHAQTASTTMTLTRLWQSQVGQADCCLLP